VLVDVNVEVGTNVFVIVGVAFIVIVGVCDNVGSSVFVIVGVDVGS
jgi:hypothetical protein